MNLREIRCEGTDWSAMPQDSVQWCVFVNMRQKSGFHIR
jgi:hypothetical protein